MAERDPFGEWLSQFQKDVDDTLGRATAAATPEARDAQQAFDHWWKAENDPLGLAREQPLPDAPRARERVLNEDWAGRVERLCEEKAALQQQVEKLSRENEALRERQGSIQGEISELDSRLSRSRSGYEGHIARLEAENKRLEEELHQLQEQKARAALELGQSQGDQRRAVEELKAEHERLALSERAGGELRRQLEEARRRLAEIGERHAAAAGAVEELRRQAATYHERLIQAKELTDQDILGLRQDLKFFVEELKIIGASVRRKPQEKP